jgi:hypothetical protein
LKVHGVRLRLIGFPVVGLSYDGAIVTGWGGMAKSEDEARAVIDELKTRGGVNNG